MRSEKMSEIGNKNKKKKLELRIKKKRGKILKTKKLKTKCLVLNAVRKIR